MTDHGAHTSGVFEDDELLTCSIRSLSPAPLRVAAAAVARRWGEDPVAAPDRAGFSERTRRLHRERLVDRLETAWSNGRELDDLWLYVERPDLDLIGDLRYYDRLAGPVDHNISFSLRASSLGDKDLDGIVELAMDLFVAIDGFVGHIDTLSMADQQFDLARMGRRRGVVPGIAAGDTSTYRPEHILDGPWWFNLYGPAFVARWGEAATARLGVDRRRLPNGGVAVWTTALPVAVDDGIPGLLGYAHQRTVTEHVGADAFLRESGSTDLPPAGDVVPMRAEHVALSGSRRTDP